MSLLRARLTVALFSIGLVGVLAGCAPAAVSPCSLLTTAELQGTLNSAFKEGFVTGAVLGSEKGCFWTGPELPSGVVVNLTVRNWDSEYVRQNWEWLRGFGQPVSGLGDEALFSAAGLSDSMSSSISIKADQRVITIGISGFADSVNENLRALTELGQLVLSRLRPEG
jgi:hypothetical protein